MVADCRSIVISSYNNFMAQSQVLSASKHYGFGLMGAITSIPAGYESSTLIAHSAGGPNIAMRRFPTAKGAGHEPFGVGQA